MLDTCAGENWDVFVFILKCETRFALFTILSQLLVLSEDGISHYTIRNCEKKEWTISFRVLKHKGWDQNQFLEALHFHEEKNDSIELINVELNPKEGSELYPYHCWIKPGEYEEKRNLSNCSMLCDLSLNAVMIGIGKTYDPVESIHLFANMSGYLEEICTKFIDKWDRQIIGPGYRKMEDKSREEIPVYYHQEGVGEKESLNYVLTILNQILTKELEQETKGA